MTRRITLSKNTIILASIAAFTVLAVWMIAVEKNAVPASPTSTQTPSSQSSLYQTQTNEGGNVTVTVTPQELAADKPATFQIVFDTHSVDLDLDVAAAAELGDEQGNMYGVPAWEGSPPGGHHRKGTLSFPTALRQATSISLTLKNIAGVKERSFVWKL